MGTLDPQKLIELKINHMNIFYMKISQIMVYAVSLALEYALFGIFIEILVFITTLTL